MKNRMIEMVGNGNFKKGKTILFGSKTNSTLDEVKIQIKDLRDLILSQNLENDEVRLQNIEVILQCIERQNKLEPGTFEVDFY